MKVVQVPRWIFIMVVIDTSLSTIVWATMLLEIFTNPSAVMP